MRLKSHVQPGRGQRGWRAFHGSRETRVQRSIGVHGRGSSQPVQAFSTGDRRHTAAIDEHRPRTKNTHQEMYIATDQVVVRVSSNLFHSRLSQQRRGGCARGCSQRRRRRSGRLCRRRRGCRGERLGVERTVRTVTRHDDRGLQGERGKRRMGRRRRRWESPEDIAAELVVVQRN